MSSILCGKELILNDLKPPKKQQHKKQTAFPLLFLLLPPPLCTPVQQGTTDGAGLESRDEAKLQFNYSLIGKAAPEGSVFRPL